MDKNFKNFKIIVQGRQLFRAVQLLFTENFIYYGTDTPEEKIIFAGLIEIQIQLKKLQRVGSSVFWVQSKWSSFFLDYD